MVNLGTTWVQKQPLVPSMIWKATNSLCLCLFSQQGTTFHSSTSQSIRDHEQIVTDDELL